METLTDCIFLGSKITADGDCSQEVKRHLLLERKAMTNLDSILKSKNITLLTKVHLVKAMFFSSIHVWVWKLDYKESWAPKNWCFWNVFWRKLLRVPWTARRSNQSILKEISPGYSLEGLMLKLKLQYFGHLIQGTDSFERTLMLGKIEDRRRRGRQKMNWLDGIIDMMVMSFEKAPGYSEGQRSLVCCSPWGHKGSDTTEWLTVKQKTTKNNSCHFTEDTAKQR